jgi:hypothetical protein
MAYPTLMTEEQKRERLRETLAQLHERGALRDQICPS